MLKEILLVLALSAVCITAQSGRNTNSRREQYVVADIDLLNSDYDSLSESESTSLSREVNSLMRQSGVRPVQVEVGPGDSPPPRAVSWSITIRIRIWFVTIEIEIEGGRKKRSTDDEIAEAIRRGIMANRGMIGGYQVDASSIVVEDADMHRGTYSLDIPLYGVEYTENMADESSPEYQMLTAPIYTIMNGLTCHLPGCYPHITIVYCYPYVHIIVIHCHHYHLWWLRNVIANGGGLDDYAIGPIVLH